MYQFFLYDHILECLCSSLKNLFKQHGELKSHFLDIEKRSSGKCKDDPYMRSELRSYLHRETRKLEMP